jgi:hypothetical protein
MSSAVIKHRAASLFKLRKSELAATLGRGLVDKSIKEGRAEFGYRKNNKNKVEVQAQSLYV